MEAHSGEISRNTRKTRIEVLARANADALSEFVKSLQDLPEAKMVRGPETGLVMVRGRMGGTGSVFNLGEATVTRATVRLSGGEVGHGQRLGGDGEAARMSAIIDALALVPGYEADVAKFVDQTATRIKSDEQARAEETSATRVNFFTMVRGDD